MSALTGTKLVIEDPLTGLPRALVPAIGEDGSSLLVDEYTWPLDDAGPGGDLVPSQGSTATAGGREPPPGPSHSPVGTAAADGARAPRHVRFDVGGPDRPGSASLMGVDHRGASGGPGGEPSGGATGDDDGSVEWAAAQAVAEPAPSPGSAAYFRGLPLTTRVRFQPHASKRGTSQPRLERYLVATTLLELQRLNPTKFMADLKHDYHKGSFPRPCHRGSLQPLKLRA